MKITRFESLGHNATILAPIATIYDWTFVVLPWYTEIA